MATATRTKLQNFIDGEFVDAAEGATDPVTNPATGEQIAKMPLSTEEDVNRAVAAARRAFDGWAAATPGERSLAMLKLADRIEQHADELADLEAADAGKPRHAFFDDEIPFLVDNLRFFAGAARVMEGRAAGEYLAEHTSIIRREPVGNEARMRKNEPVRVEPRHARGAARVLVVVHRGEADDADDLTRSLHEHRAA